jgi:hypothetical protein
MKRKNRKLITTPVAALLTAVAVAACGTATAATISNSGTPGTGTSTAATTATTAAGPASGQMKAFVDCMRSHGIAGFGDGGVAAPAPGTSSTVSSTGTSTGATVQAGTGTTAASTKPAAGPPQGVVAISGSFSHNGHHSGFSLRWKSGGKPVSAAVMRAAMQACTALLPHPPAPTAAQIAAASAKAKAFNSCLTKHGVTKLRTAVAMRGGTAGIRVKLHAASLKNAKLPAVARVKALKLKRLASVHGVATQVHGAGRVIAPGRLSVPDKRLAKAVQTCGGPALSSSSAGSAAPSISGHASSK